ncbi:MAG: GTP 3',8-cyclase MoaA, partial [Desulfobaccales bacterium]
APVDRPATAGPARTFRIRGFQGELGFISSVSEHHCPDCNRLRLTAAGHLRPCLFAAPEVDIKGPLRRGADDQALGRLFQEAMAMKKFKAKTGMAGDLFRGRAMVSIGG